MEKLPAWVRETARVPIAFAQVREDALLDQWVVENCKEGCAVLMVASGGCTAALLAAMPRVSRLHLIDANPAQIALSRFKLQLLATATSAERLSILGHDAMPAADRRSRIAAELQSLNLSPDAIGPIDLVANLGPDHAGRYEILFSKLREALGKIKDDIGALLRLRDPGEQARRVEPTTALGQVFDSAFDDVMALPNLVALFGEGATRNRCEPFSRHFAQRTRHVLSSMPAADNPYLWYMLQGRFPPGIVYPWLTCSAPSRLPEIAWTVSTMVEALQKFPAEFDFIHLSNILDWLAPEEARATLDLAWKALRPGGCTFIRQLNSSLEIEKLGSRFAWQDATKLHERDRSFFYRRLHLGRKE